MLATCCRFCIQRFGSVAGGFGLAVLVMAAGPSAAADSDDPMVRIGVRADAAPFSKRSDDAAATGTLPLCSDKTANPVDFRGYTIDLCIDFINDLRAVTQQELSACFVPVVTGDEDGQINRFSALDDREIDMLCGATTATLEVSSRYRASLVTFLSATTFMQNDARVKDRLAQDAPLRIGVLRNTTSDVRTSPDALAQQRKVQDMLGSARAPVTIVFDSHDDVAKNICSPRSAADCIIRPQAQQPAVEARTPEETESAETPGVQEKVPCRQNLTLRQWVRRVQDGCVPVAEDAPAVPLDEPDGRSPRTAMQQQIDLYIADLPILDALLDRMAVSAARAGVSIDRKPLKTQPYAVIFPPRDPARARPELRGLPDLHFAFNRFLVENTYHPDNRDALRKRLKAHFSGGAEASFLRLIPLMEQVPIGTPPQSPAADSTGSARQQ